MANSYLSISGSTPTNSKKFTYSFWVKRTTLGADQAILSYETDSANRGGIELQTGDQFRYFERVSNSTTVFVEPSRVFRDPSAWYHIVVATDTTQSTEADRVKIYVNGVQETDFASTPTYPALNSDTRANGSSVKNIGRRNVNNDYFFDGALSHVSFVDGSALAPTVFGETESTSGIWKFKQPSGVTWGNNGFHLKFENSASLGLDSSGNTNNFTVSGNLVQSVDTPSNVFCTMNPIVSNRSGFTFSNNNTTVNTPSTSGSAANMGVKQGKWYFECLINTLGNFYGGWQDLDNVATNTNSYMVDGTVATNNGPDIYYGTSSSSANSMNGMAQGDYIGFAIDVPNLKCWWSRNGQWYTADSATPTTLTRAQVSANNNGFDLTTGSEMNSSSTIAPYMGTSTAATNNSFNFGTGIFGTTKLTGTTYADDNGVGIFKYEPPAGFRAICTKNINTYG